jgi:hypothetical protein
MFQILGTPFIMYGVQTLAAIVCIAAIVRAIFIPTDMRRSPSCGGCGYPIAADAPTRCPECGGQLTKVGISTPSMAVRLRGTLTAALLAWTVICGMLAQVGWGYVQQAAWSAMNIAAMNPAPSKTQHTRSTTLAPQRTFNPNTSTRDLSFRIDLDSTYVEDASVIESGTATLTLRENGTDETVTLQLDIAADTFIMKDNKGATILQGKSTDFNTAAATKWFETAGFSISTDADKTTRADVLKLVNGLYKDPEGIETMFSMGGMQTPGALYSNGGSSSTGPVGGGGFARPMTPNYWTLHAKIIVGVIATLYLAGFIAIWRKRRRVLS